MRRALALFVLIVMAPAAPVLQAVATAAEPPAKTPSVHMSDPRSFGHFVGDLLTRTAHIEVSDGESFVPASLPGTGQLAYWLELRDVKAGESTRAGSRHLALDLTYQLFYVPIDTRRLVIPAFNIEITGPKGNRLATVPAFTLLVSPIREIYPEKSGETTATFLKEDAPAERLRTGPARTAALTASFATALALLLLAYHNAWWPFRARAGRPFTEAQRTVDDHRQPYAAALIALHRAFDRAQGERLFAADVDRFLTTHPEQSATRDAVQKFFGASQTFFFGGDKVAAEAAMPRSALERLASALAVNERSAR